MYLLSLRRLAALLLVVSLLSAACGGDDESAGADDPTEESDAEADEPTEAEPAEGDEADDESAQGADDVKDEPDLDAPATPVAPTAPPAPEPTTPPAPTAPPAPPAPEPAPAQTEAMSDMDQMIDSGGATSYDSYTAITDDTGSIQVEVPSEWTQVDGRPFTDEQGRQLFDVRAAADLQGFAETWDVPGIIVTASTEVAQTENEVTLLDELVGPLSGVCTYVGREPYDDGLYTGQIDLFDNCGGTTTSYAVLGAVPDSRAFVIRLQVQVVEERDLEALIRALNTFIITGDV